MLFLLVLFRGLSTTSAGFFLGVEGFDNLPTMESLTFETVLRRPKSVGLLALSIGSVSPATTTESIGGTEGGVAGAFSLVPSTLCANCLTESELLRGRSAWELRRPFEPSEVGLPLTRLVATWCNLEGLAAAVVWRCWDFGRGEPVESGVLVKLRSFEVSGLEKVATAAARVEVGADEL